MKILLVASSFYPRIGGVEGVVAELAKEFSRRGHGVSIVTNRYPRTLPGREVFNGMTVRRLFFMYPRCRYLSGGRLDLLLAGVVLAPVTFFRLCIAILQSKPDVVNLHYLGSAAAFLLPAKWLLGFRLVVSLHGADVQIEPRQSSFNGWLFRTTMRAAEKITFCSNALLKEAASEGYERDEKCVVILNGVNIDLFANAKPEKRERQYVLAAGRLEHQKGFDVLLEAFAIALKGRTDIDLIIAGEGSLKRSLEVKAAELSLSRQAIFPGPCSAGRIASLMKGSLMVVIPSRREPFGIVGLEARVAGATILSTTAGGLPEALQGAPVTWAAPGSVADLASAIQSALTQRSKVSPREGMAVDPLLSEFSWSAKADEYLKVYTS